MAKGTRKNINQLLKAFLRTKNPYTRDTDPQNGSLHEDEWKYIVNYMYNSQDAQCLLQTLAALYKESSLASYKLPSRVKVPVPKPSLPYSVFFNSVLEFQITGHDRLLSGFRAKFREMDEDGDGVLDDTQFSQLLASLNCLEHSECYLEALDPHETGTFLFSDCVELFMKETLRGDTVSVIYKLYLTMDQ